MINTIRLAAPLEKENLINGEGIRMVIWCQGCKIKCPYCQNSETWNLNGGKEYSIVNIKAELKKYANYHNGLTLSGGDPFLQPEACLEITKYAKEELGLNIWAYCGMTYEEIIQNAKRKELLQYIDVLIDGPFKINECDTTLAWRGSRNQRIIDVKETLKTKEVKLYN